MLQGERVICNVDLGLCSEHKDSHITNLGKIYVDMYASDFPYTTLFLLLRPKTFSLYCSTSHVAIFVSVAFVIALGLTKEKEVLSAYIFPQLTVNNLIKLNQN